MTEDDLYKIERWVEKMEAQKRFFGRTDHGLVGTALRYLGQATAEIRRCWTLVGHEDTT